MADNTHLRLKRLRSSAVRSGEADQAFGFQERLAESEWFSSDKIKTYQLGHLKRLAGFAALNAPYYASKIDMLALMEAKSLREALDIIPIQSRYDLATQSLSFRSATLPQGHHKAGERISSGSSGQIIAVEGTNISFAWQHALNFRAQLWAGRKFDLPMAVIRKFGPELEPSEGIVRDRWDDEAVLPVKTGPANFLATTYSVEHQWKWLAGVKPAYLMSYPSIIRQFAILAAAEKRSSVVLKGISTVGETVSAELRDDARRFLGADIYDVYSAEEVGVIASQCPTCRRYHIQSEAIIVEIVDMAGKPCAAGEIGRVIVTPLFNFATPLLRYELGDMAEAGSPCACGRGLGVINRVVGRYRNLLTLPDGQHFWPSMGSRAWQKIIPIKRHQFRQVALDRMEVWMVVETQPTQAAQDEVRAIIASRLPGAFTIDFQFVDDIPNGSGGKFEEFVSLL